MAFRQIAGVIFNAIFPMKKMIGSGLLMLAFALMVSLSAQNAQSLFTEVKLYDNGDGTGSVEARVNPGQVGSFTVTEMRLSGGRVGGLCVLSGTVRSTPWSMSAGSGPGNGGSVTLVAVFPLRVPASGGPDHLDLEIDLLRRVDSGGTTHYMTDMFSAGHILRSR
jgi:hypothetical protein